MRRKCINGRGFFRFISHWFVIHTMIKKYAALIRANWALTSEYRAEIVLWMMGSLWVVVMMLVWIGVADGRSINGYAAADYVSYYMVTLFVRNMTAVWSSYELDYQIRQGQLSPKLLRPIHPLHWEISFNLSEKVLRAMIVIPIVVVVLAVLSHAPLDMRPLAVVAFLISLMLAWLITFFSDYAIGILAFWTSQSTAFVQVFDGIRSVLSGVLAPIAMFPDALQAVLAWLPFRYMISFSVEILTGKLRPEQIVQGFAIQSAWALVMVLLVKVMWRRAMKSYSAVGA